MFEREKFPVSASANLLNISESHSLRCDSRQFETRFLMLDELLNSTEIIYLNEFLPNPLVKGTQHIYMDDGEGIPVVNTLSIQKMTINIKDCRHISEESFDKLTNQRRLKVGDVLVTMDGGTSIGKPVLFDLDGEYTVDSHVAILRPVGISPKALVYLLASPLGQLQFQKYESGASGQTAVTEEDLRRFRIPLAALTKLEKEVEEVDKKRMLIESQRESLDKAEKSLWESFTLRVLK